MYMNLDGRQQLVKNSLGPEPGSVPASGPTAIGASFRVLTSRAGVPVGPADDPRADPIPTR